ncbi:MAG: hypothetical protein HY303_14345 [Candidatus Wallbacteria bacterium]|nr:hypothetical protein [Candidatus Wallbacteria bacterium]
MEREPMGQGADGDAWTSDVGELFRAFFLFRESFLAARREPALAAAARLVESRAREIALALWDRIFGKERLAAPDHQGFLDRWCLQGLETLRRAGVLSSADWLMATEAIATRWEELGKPGTGHDFSTLGPDGPAGAALRNLYLLHQLFIAIDEMVVAGIIPEAARAAALENIRLRAPVYWKPLMPEEKARLERLRTECVTFAGEEIRLLARDRILPGEDAARLLDALGVPNAKDSEDVTAPSEPSPPDGPPAATSADPLVLQAELVGKEAVPVLRQAQDERKGGEPAPAAAALPLSESASPILEGSGERPEVSLSTGGPGGRVPLAVPVAEPQRDSPSLSPLLHDLRALEDFRPRVRMAVAQLPAAAAGTVLEAVDRVRDSLWQKALGAAPAETSLPAPVRQDLLAALRQRLEGGLLRRALAVLSEAAEPRVVLTAEAAASDAAPAPGLDPAAYDPGWVRDVGAFATAAAEESAARPKHAGQTTGRYSAPPRRAAALPRKLPALLEELSIHWLLFLGAFLVLGGGIVLAIGAWGDDPSGAGRYMPLALTTVFFEGLAWMTSSALGLAVSGRAMAWVAMALIPLNALAIALLDLAASPRALPLAAVSALAIAALATDTTRRALAAPHEPLPGDRVGAFLAALLLVCGLTASWPTGHGVLPAHGAIAALVLAGGMLAPFLGWFAQAGRGLSPGTVATATLLLLLSYGCFGFRILFGAAWLNGPAALILAGGMHVAQSACDQLRRLSAGREEYVSAAGAFELLGWSLLVIAVPVAMQDGPIDNPWLIALLGYLCHVFVRAYLATGSPQTAQGAFSAALIAQVLLVYGVKAVYHFWSGALHGLLGSGFPVGLLPQMLIGFAATLAAPTVAKLCEPLVICCHVTGLATALAGTTVAVAYHAQGLPICLAVVGLYAGAAGFFGFAYMAVVAVAAALSAVAAILLHYQAGFQVWTYAGIAFSWIVVLAGRAGLDAVLEQMDPLFVPGLRLSAIVAPVCWVAQLQVMVLALDQRGDTGPTVLAILALSVLWAWRALEHQDEPAAWASVAGPVLIYLHLRIARLIGDHYWVHLVAIVAAYPLSVFAAALAGPLAVYRRPLRHVALALPCITAGYGVFVWTDPMMVSFELMWAGVYYSLLPWNGESRSFFYLGAVYFNLANFFFWRPYTDASVLLWTVPLGLTLHVLTHVNKGELTPEVRENMRILGSIVMSGQPLWEVVVYASPWEALVLGGMAAFGVVAALHFRVRAYLLHASLLLIVDAGAFIVRRVWELSQFGAMALVVAGLVLIGLATAFERGREQLLARWRSVQTMTSDWE